MMFIPAKIMADGTNFYFITLEEHNRHVGNLAEKLGITEGKFASQNHDIGKERNLLKNLKNKYNVLYFLNAYCRWLKAKGKIKNDQERKIGLIIHNVFLDSHEKLNQLKFLGIDDKNSRSLINLSPFPDHAKKCPKSEDMDDYNYELIRHHHTFNVKELVPLGWRFGRYFIKDLHIIISADRIVANIYEKTLNKESNFKVGTLDQDDFLIHDYLIEGKVRESEHHNDSVIKKIDLEINSQNFSVEVKLYRVRANGG